MIALRCAPPGEQATDIRLGVEPGTGLQLALDQLASARQRFTLADAALATLQPVRLQQLRPDLLLPGGEGVKNFAQLEALLRAIARAELGRDGVLVVVGGGSLGDLGGLAAALYARGVELALLPTTLLAMVDSCVGGKTAIDLPEGKNLVGALHPARTVAIDLGFLETLPDVEFRSGLGEVVKVAIGLSAPLFDLLEARADAVLARDPELLGELVRLALAAKIEVVEADPRERGRRRVLNLGHTLGHALEAQTEFGMPHGLAVARGLHFAIDVAAARGALATADAERARSLLARYGFEPHPVPRRDQLAPFLRRDKKAVADGVRFVVPTAVGRAEAVHVPLSELLRALPE